LENISADLSHGKTPGFDEAGVHPRSRCDNSRKEMKMLNEKEQKGIDELAPLAPEFAKLTRDFLFGDIWERPGLSQRDKSLITVTCLVALNRIEQVEFHLRKAFENGLTKEELVAAITHIAFYAGWPTAASGFSHLKKVIDQQ
jgi:4-carboxymuconolactone decarboxylase